MITCTESNFNQQWLSWGFMWICYSWKHSWNEIRLKTCSRFSNSSSGSLPLSKLRAGHVLEAAADKMPSIVLSGRTEPHPVALSHRGGPYCAEHLCSGCFGRDHSSGQEHTSPQSAVFSRCAVPLCLVIHITNSLAPGSSSWINLTVCGVACGVSLDSHIGQTKYVRMQNPYVAHF